MKKLFLRNLQIKVERPLPALRGDALGCCGHVSCCGK